MSAPGAPPSPSDALFEGLTYGRAWNAFWLGFAALFCLGFLTGIPAIFVGAQALTEIRLSEGRLRGRGTAWAGVVMGAIGTVAATGVAAYLQGRR